MRSRERGRRSTTDTAKVYAREQLAKPYRVDSPSSGLPFQDEKSPEASGVEECLGFTDPTAAPQRSQITGGSTGTPCCSTLLDQLLDPVGTQEVRLQAHTRGIELQELVERQIDGDVDPAGIGEPVIDLLVISIGTKPATRSAVEFLDGGHVVEHHDPSIGMPGTLRNDPAHSGVDSRNRSSVGNRRGSRVGAVDQHELPVLDIDIEHHSPVSSSYDDVEWQVVEQFVCEHDVDALDELVVNLGE